MLHSINLTLQNKQQALKMIKKDNSNNVSMAYYAQKPLLKQSNKFLTPKKGASSLSRRDQQSSKLKFDSGATF